MSTNKAKRKLWHAPWKFAENLIITGVICLLAFMFEFGIKDSELQIPSWPINVLILLAFIGILLIIFYTNRHSSIIYWASSKYVTTCSIGLNALILILMGTIPQHKTLPVLSNLGLTHISHSFIFLFSQIFLLTSLGFTILRRLSITWNKNNIAFFLNHFGIWLVLAVAFTGSGDLKKYNILLVERAPFSNIMYKGDKIKTSETLPFKLQLKDFHLETYPARLGIRNTLNNEEMIFNKELSKGNTNLSYKYKQWEIEPFYFIELANKIKNDFVESDYPGSAPALYVKLRDTTNIFPRAGWVSCGSYSFDEKSISLGNGYELFMPELIPFKYYSDILIKEGNKTDSFRIEINSPLKYKNWKIYQNHINGYQDNNKVNRTASYDMSELTIVKDPWLPIVYLGLSLLFIGAILFIWKGNK